MSAGVIQVVLPVALKEVFDAIAPEFSARFGDQFEVSLMLNPEVPGHIERGAEWSIAFSNPVYIHEVVAKGFSDRRVYDLGYSPLCFATTGNSADRGPVLHNPDDIAAFLRGVATIGITKTGTSAAQFVQFAEHLQIARETKTKLRWLPGGGPMTALRRKEVDVAVLPLSNVAAVPGVFAKAICPVDLGVQVDLSFCLSADANQATQRFATWLLDAGLQNMLSELGILPAHRQSFT